MYLKDHCHIALWKSRQFIFLSSWFRAETDDVTTLMLSDHCSIKLLETLSYLTVFITTSTSFFMVGGITFDIDHSPHHSRPSSSTFSSPRTTSVLPQPPPPQFHEFKYPTLTTTFLFLTCLPSYSNYNCFII